MGENVTSYSDGWSDPLFETKKLSGLSEMWDRAQRNQVDYGFYQELIAYYNCSQWDRAESVLDLGVGNGYYLEKLATYFPDKSYVGIDISEEFIAFAKARETAQSIQFRQCDFYDVSDSYDFVIMRLFLQHMRNVPSVLDHVAKITNPGGAALIIDSHNPLRLFKPPAPEIMKFLAAYKEQQAEQGLDRDVSIHLDKEIHSHPLWTLGDKLRLIYATTFPGMMKLYRETIYLMIQIVEITGTMEYDFAPARREWDWWCNLEDAYAQIGVNIVRIDREMH